MITRFLTGVKVVFSPFNNRGGKTARKFLAMLPPNARKSMSFDIKMTGKTERKDPGSLALTFKDGKQMDMVLETLKLNDLMVEVDRHSRALARQEDLKG